MKKYILVLLLTVANLYACSQNLDLIVKINNDSVFCRIDSVSGNHVYFKVPYKKHWINAYLLKNDIKTLKRNAIDSKTLPGEGVKIKIYRVWVTLYKAPFKVRGVLYAVKDSSVSISAPLKKTDYSLNRFDILNFRIKNIKKISVRRKNRIGRGAAFGTLPGLILSGIAYASGDDPPGSWGLSAEEKALMTLPLAAFGAGLGALIGASKSIFLIKGNMEKFEKYRNRLENHSVKHQQKHDMHKM